MPQSAPHVLVPTRAGYAPSSAASVEPAFSMPVRWMLRVLSWLAFGVASYVAWHAMHQTAVAGCGVGSSSGCDVVLSSSWSKWLGIPVVFAGLACYSALAILSILLELRNESANRAVTTIFVMLSIVAAGASLWFIGIQIFAIGSYCPYCLVTDACGIAIGTVATFALAWSLIARRSAPRPRTMQPGMMALRSATSAGAPSTPAMKYASSSPPSLGFALGGAVPLLALLIGGQLLFAAKTYEVQKVELKDSIELVGDDAKTSDDAAASDSPETRVAMRVPTEPEGEPAKPDATVADAPTEGKGSTAAPNAAGTDTDSNATKVEPETPVEQPKRERLVKFLNGKLTLDVFKHPLIGSPDASHIVVEMISYDCTHCRKMHAMMKRARARYGNQVALLVMPVPLDKDCNKLITDQAASHRGACVTARMAVCIAKLSPNAFVKFHDFVMTGEEKPPGVERILPKGYSLVNSERLRALVRGPEVKKQLESYVDLYAQLQKQNRGKKEFGLPVQILGDHVMSGSVEKADDIFKAWEEHLGVTPK